MTDAFVSRIRVNGAPTGPLAGLSFAVKDLIDVAGVPTRGGNPDWPRYAGVPERHAWVVETLLGAGASVVGKTVTDEVSLGDIGGERVRWHAVEPGCSRSGAGRVVQRVGFGGGGGGLRLCAGVG
jgi:Asp-tRNA(Asn)/Glu-tRNA(Gln) amidotransferase A subunit family amidase